MKTLFVLAAATLLLLNVMSANPVSCTIPGGGVVTYNTPSSLTMTCGALTFSNFDLVSSTPSPGNIGKIDIIGLTYDSATGEVDMTLNPNLGASQVDDLLFQVSGGVTQLDLAVGGNDATITERACSTSIPTSGSGAFLCPSGTMLGQVSDYSNDPAAPVFSSSFPVTSPIYIVKDIGTGAGGSLSSFTESFETNARGHVPEPISLVLLGSGLLALGMFRRRAHKS